MKNGSNAGQCVKKCTKTKRRKRELKFSWQWRFTMLSSELCWHPVSWLSLNRSNSLLPPYTLQMEAVCSSKYQWPPIRTHRVKTQKKKLPTSDVNSTLQGSDDGTRLSETNFFICSLSSYLLSAYNVSEVGNDSVFRLGNQPDFEQWNSVLYLQANWTISSIFYQITVSVKHVAICAYVTTRTIDSNVLCKYATLHWRLTR